MVAMPVGLEAELTAALGAFNILTPFSFSFMGEPAIDASSISTAAGWTGAPTEANPEQLLARAIQASLYDHCYAHRVGNAPGGPDRQLPVEDANFARRLTEANTSRERWDTDWMIYQLGANGQVFVRKGERERIAMPGTFISDFVMGQALQIGASVRLRAPREATGLQPGYYFAFGETLDEVAEQLSLVRFYFHCAAENAAPLLAALSSALNRFQVPFQVKAPISPALYGRTDAVVLYVAARFFAIVARIASSVREHTALDLTVPLFTKQLWPGIGVAVEPGTGESFGSHRCRLCAEGIVDAWREGKQDAAARLKAAAARFATAGLDITRPYLGPGWVDLFSLPASPRFP
jgi:HopA1 effector protein family